MYPRITTAPLQASPPVYRIRGNADFFCPRIMYSPETASDAFL